MWSVAPAHFSLRTSLVSELALACHDHGSTGLVRCLDDLGVTHRAAWLNDAGDSRRRGLLHAVCKRKESVRGEHAAGNNMVPLAGFVDREKYAVYPAHLPGPDTNGSLIPRQENRIGLDRGHRRPCEPE